MPKKPKIPKEEAVFENPFSDNLLPAWDAWKRYKANTWKFKYKTFDSENAALRRLFRLSDGNESAAIEILDDCIAFQWMGIYTTKNKQYGTNSHIGTSYSGNSNGKPGTSEARTEAISNWGRTPVR